MTYPAPASRPETAPWTRQLRDAIRDPHELAAALGLPVESLAPAEVIAAFPLRVPRAFVARMRKGDPNDPLLRQVWPLAAEAAAVPGFGADPLDEAQFSRDGVVSKYAGRSLLITTGACPVHCRYCFRREFPYGEQLAARGDFEAAVEALAAAQVSEVILSGGDPLSLGNRKLAALFARLERVPTVTRIRLHTRFPIVLPARVDAGLLELLAGSARSAPSAPRSNDLTSPNEPPRRVVVVHANHPNELDADVAAALRAIAGTGATLLNQSVLLRGVNDDAGTLCALSERLHACGVLPYYLHLLDRVTGAAHFDVPEAEAVVLHRALQAQLPGYLVPRLVREVPGGAGKTPIAG